MTARLIVGGDEGSFYEKPNGAAWGAKPYAIWSAFTGGTRYTDLLHIDGTAAGSGEVNEIPYTGGVLLTGLVDGSFGAQLPDGLDVPGVWVDFDDRSSRVYLAARQPDGTPPASAQAVVTAALAAETAARENADAALTPQTRLVAGHALTADVTLAKSDVGLGNVDNTADSAKPVSTAQASANAAARDAAIAGAPVQAVAGLTGSPTAAQLETAGLLRSSTASATFEAQANKGQPSGYAGLGSDGTVPAGQLPAAATGAVARSAATGTGGGFNIVNGAAVNAIDSGQNASTVAGGGTTSWPNKVSGSSGAYNTVGGGYDNDISSTGIGACTVAGGAHHRISGVATHGTVGGGSYHAITAGDYGTISGGTRGILSGSNATVGGGARNEAAGDSSTVAGGQACVVTGVGSTVTGGVRVAVGGNSSIGGGSDTLVGGSKAVVAGGDSNQSGKIRTVTDAAISLNGTTLTSATAVFAVGDVGRPVLLAGAGVSGATLVARIASRTSATSVELSRPADTAVSGATLTISESSTFGDFSVTSGGYQNALGTTAAANYSAIGGGRGHSVQAQYATIPGGRSNQVLADYGSAQGYGAVARRYGQVARASGFVATAGDTQTSVQTLWRQTTNNTATELRLDGSSQRLVLDLTSTYTVEVLGVARRTDTPGTDGAWRVTGLLTVGASTAAVVWNQLETLSVSGFTAYAFAVAADTTNGALSITGTGATGHTVSWLADVRLVKVSG